MRILALSLMLAAAAQAGEWPEAMRGQKWADRGAMALIDQLGDADTRKRALARTELRARGFRALPALLHRQSDPDPARRRAVAKLIGSLYSGAVPRFAVKDATLVAACAELERISGLRVFAKGQAARPITLDLPSGSFWTAVLAICKKGGVGLAPHFRSNRYDRDLAPYLPFVSARLGREFPAPKNAYVSGPVLVQLDARAIGGERAGTLEISVRTLPRVPVLASARPRMSNGIDWES
ncbi:MAG: hypothetical protein OER88_10420 [Planctomycetota bacterium]|nr:hypothetical protein [Planctomycetota bacterium]